MISSWHRVLHAKRSGGTPPSVPDIMGFVFKDSGPSILITSATTCLAFAVGATTPTPEIRLFCQAAALAMLLDFVYEITFFGSFLSLASRFSGEPKQDTAESDRTKTQLFLSKFLRGYCQLLTNMYIFVGVMIAAAALLLVTWRGVLTMEAKLDVSKILPQDSPLQASNKALESMVWNDYHTVVVLVNKQTNFTEPQQYKMFNDMVAEFEAIQYSLGSDATQLWLKDYLLFLDIIQSNQSTFELETTGSSTVAAEVDAVNLQYVAEFFDDKAFQAWESMVRWKINDGVPVIERFMFVCAYHGTAAWAVRIDLMQRWRKIATDYNTHFNTSVWQSEAHFVDQMLSLKRVTLETVLITILVMAVVCLLFIRNLLSVLCTIAAVGSICIGVVGLLNLWGLDLDPVVMAALLMSIGLSVDFTAHISYHYHHTDHAALPAVRLQTTLEAILWPMLQAGLSTICCVAPLVLLQGHYAPEIFFKTIILVVLLGVLHGLVFLPALLVALPASFSTVIAKVYPSPSA